MSKNERNVNDVSNRLDWGIIFCILMLALTSLTSIFIAVSHDNSTTSVIRQVIPQLIWYVIGTVSIIVIMQFDSEQLWKLTPIAYWIGIFLLFAVLFLYSRSTAALTGARNWFQIGPLSFQPSEVMKPPYILMLAKVTVQHNNRYPTHTTKTDWILIGKLFLWVLPITVLIKLQNDFGTILVFYAILIGVILVSGVTWRIIAPISIVVSILGITALILAGTNGGQHILQDLGFQAYQFARVNNWLNPSGDTSNQGYQLWQSIKAVGSGSITGTGFNVSHVYVPVRESDMIFSVIGENFGFIGGCLLILLYFYLIYKMIQVTFDSRNVFYAYISTGVIMMILFHVFENVGMSIGLLPLTGIPLPFVSQGGSALIGNMMGVGLVMSMQFHNHSYMFSQSDSFS